VDPGSELWGRYSLNGSSTATPRSAAIPALAHIIYTSSPQAKDGGTPRSVGGFRRTNSCGSQFPKRRRVGGSEEDDVFTESVSLGPSKLSVLIERVQEGLSQPKPSPVEHEKSDSILRGKIKFPINGNRPTQQPQQHMVTPKVNNGFALDTKRPQNSPAGDSNGSDYGDFDDEELGDASMLDALVVKPQLPVVHTSKHSRAKLPPDPPPQKAGSSAGVNYRPPHPPVARIPLANFVVKAVESKKSRVEADEFDDSDEELFAAVTDDMVANLGTQSQAYNAQHVSKVSGSSISQRGVALKSESDDEFGDDGLDGLDDSDFQVVELAATQSIQLTSSSLQPVRTRYP